MSVSSTFGAGRGGAGRRRCADVGRVRETPVRPEGRVAIRRWRLTGPHLAAQGRTASRDKGPVTSRRPTPDDGGYRLPNDRRTRDIPRRCRDGSKRASTATSGMLPDTQPTRRAHAPHADATNRVPHGARRATGHGAPLRPTSPRKYPGRARSTHAREVLSTRREARRLAPSTRVGLRTFGHSTLSTQTPGCRPTVPAGPLISSTQ
jgi:hypothetical protein